MQRSRSSAERLEVSVDVSFRVSEREHDGLLAGEMVFREPLGFGEIGSL